MYNKPTRINSTILARRMKEIRESKGIKKSEMAKDLGLAASTMTYYEQGKSIPSADWLYAIADYLGTSIDYLVGRSEKNKEFVHTEKDIAELLLNMLEFKGIELRHDNDDGSYIHFTHSNLKQFMDNHRSLEQIKGWLSDGRDDEMMLGYYRAREENEKLLSDVLSDERAMLKSGDRQVGIRRKR